MHRLSSIILLLGLTVKLFSQSPHGAQFKVNCADCHSSAGWDIPYNAWDRTGPIFSKTTGWQIGWDTARFSHTKTDFPLTGQHVRVDCRDCHQSMVFSQANSDCVSCHTDMHNGTVGKDCARCHNTENWLVDNISEIHHDNGFPLLGPHALAACTDCHKSESALRFDPIGNECVNCHLADFAATSSPNHQGAGFSTNCVDCHDVTRFDWNTDRVNHDFFPLTKGHDISDCAKCHTAGSYSNTPSDCISCHKTDYQSAVNPNHQSANFSQNCIECHTTDPDWMPATFAQHDAEFFPIYSGGHKGAWNKCADCHTNPSNFAEYTCVTCHVNPETNNQHSGVNGYSYNSPACLACHPTGNKTDVFDHNNTAFPLTGAHLTTDCAACHTSGYAGTPKDCAACHTTDYNQSANPNHSALAIPTDCAGCHTTSGWEPATFAIHNNYYTLNGAHAAIAGDCAKCHNGNYNNTPNTCAGCHTPDYNQTTNPNHAAAQFPMDCATCHNETAWVPSTFDHNSFYPLTGAHAAIANNCDACHNGNYTNTPNTCAGCHTPDYNQSANPNHVSLNIPTNCESCHTTTGWEPATFAIHNSYYPLSGAHAAIAGDCAACHNGNYINTPNTCAGCHIADYNQTTSPSHASAQFPKDCATCHSETAWIPSTFDHSTFYPLTGAHATIAYNCQLCHNGNYTNTPNTCEGCHTPDYNQSANPNHSTLAIPTDCAGCHTTAGWAPASFAIHNNYYPLNGAHATIANDCAACHNGNYNNTPNTCAGCHTSDYNQTTNPNHTAAQFPTDCAGCHSETAWVPATFDHDGQYFPIYSGKHQGQWDQCVDCHTNPSNFAEFTCTTCHANPETNNQHNGVNGYSYNSPACLACHPTGDATNGFDHNNTAFPLTGAHLTADCIDCHASGYAGTPTDCAACHTTNYNQSSNPNHVTLAIPTNCANCHTTSGWAPATFAIHDNYYPLTGAHATIANDCNACHNGNYTNTPNTCAGCHTPDYNQSTNPNHVTLAIPTDCESCHTPAGWAPATFAIHNNYYPLNGAHAAIANDCAACHNGNYNNTPNTCAGCHMPDYNQTTNPNHVTQQFPTNCAECHSETAWVPSTFNHDNYYPLVGAHAAIANNCNICHNGNYVNTPNTCIGCHQADYNQTNNPNHTSAGFPTTCQDCHSQTAWIPANFDHDGMYFPIYSGSHENVWDQCTDCHISPGNYAVFSCTVCHTNPQTNNQHQGVNGYQYSSPACYACHPDGTH